MTDMTTFEQRLAGRLEAELGANVRPFDPALVAAAAMGRRTVADQLRTRLRLGPLPMDPTSRRVALVAAVALLALATLALAVGLRGSAGPRLVLIDRTGSVVVADADGSDASVVFDVENPILFTEITWAPDGRHLALTDETFRLVILDADGTVTGSHELEDGRSTISWAPDGRRLAVYDGRWLQGDGAGFVHPRLDVVGLHGAVEWTAPLPDDFRYAIGAGEVAWSPDGRWIAITGAAYKSALQPPNAPSLLWLVDVDQRTVRRLQPEDNGERNAHPTWLPDGRLLYSQLNTGIWSIDPVTAEEQILFDLRSVACESCTSRRVSLLEPSPDGRSVLFVASGLGLEILDLSTGATRDPPPLPQGVGSDFPIRWTPDGSALVFRVGPVTDEPFFANQVGSLDLRTGELSIVATNAVRFDLRPD